MPRNFHAYGRNNHETWKPALTLEEPDDPSRVCHYAKQLVYPPGAGVEYSPEELLARKYSHRLEQQRKKLQQQLQQSHLQTTHHEQQQQPKEEIKKESSIAPEEQQQQMYDSYESGNSYYMTAVNGEVYEQNDDEAEEEQDEDEEEDIEHKQLSEQSEEEESDGDGEDSDQQDDKIEQPKQPSYTNGMGTVDMQFKAQTTFDQNRSIKMKFKKERTLESSTYSAYTIESIYHHQQQHELPSPAAVAAVPVPAPSAQTLHASSPIAAVQDWTGGVAVQRQRNGGNHFHPYLGQTSTPKSDGRRARVKAKLNSKFQPELYSNSNSSCSVAEQAAAANGIDTASTTAPAERDASSIAPIHNATFNDNANFSFSSTGGLDNSNSSLAMAVGRLHFRDASQVSTIKLQHPHNNNNNNNTTTPGTTLGSTTITEFSTFQENSYFATQHDSEAQERRLSKALETIERHFAKEAIDPFNSELCRAFLAKLNFPGDDDAHASYKVVQTPLPKISNTRTLNVLESVQFNIDKEVGRGSYGSVYKATDTQTGNVVALKYQKPPNTWEIYICDQVSKA